MPDDHDDRPPARLHPLKFGPRSLPAPVSMGLTGTGAAGGRNNFGREQIGYLRRLASAMRVPGPSPRDLRLLVLALAPVYLCALTGRDRSRDKRTALPPIALPRARLREECGTWVTPELRGPSAAIAGPGVLASIS